MGNTKDNTKDKKRKTTPEPIKTDVGKDNNSGMTTDKTALKSNKRKTSRKDDDGKDEDDGGKNSTLIIIVAVVAVVLIALTVFGGVMYAKRANDRSNRTAAGGHIAEAFSNPMYDQTPVGPVQT